jgi:hypothetical protein
VTEQMNWLRTRVRAAVVLVVVGLALLVGSLVAAAANPGSNFGIVGGIGIAISGGGLGMIVKYGGALRGGEAARRAIIQERDERGVMIRTRAGNRAFWVGIAIAWLGLMWVSFAANGRVPALDGDALWNFLAGAVLVPFAVYAASVVVDERRS